MSFTRIAAELVDSFGVSPIPLNITDVLAGLQTGLINAVVVALNGQVIWRHVDRPKLMMRSLTEAEIDAYLAAAGPDILSSVGAYQVEKLGARLFDDIKGNYFAVLGMSLLPLLDVLRREGAIDF